MPIYEYYCANCKQEFEVLRPASQSQDSAPCTSCQEPAKRQLSTFSFKSNTFTAPKLKRATKPMRSYDLETPAEPAAESTSEP
ncbi:MAG: zinc ribbon domain-containing protein [Chloroflexi bacterium]|nr:zinc ribbon domain-containing protein [Chloroflexota bacterium]